MRKVAMARETARPSFNSSEPRSSAICQLPLAYVVDARPLKRTAASARRALDHREKRKQTVARRTFGLRPSARAIDRSRPRDVAMDPRGIAYELPQKERGRDRAAVPITGLLQVGHVALDLLSQVFDERHAPHRFARLLQGSRK